MQTFRIRFFYFLPILFILLIASCSGGSVSPIDVPLELQQSENSVAAQNRYTWGIWKIQISSDHGTVEAIPARAAEMHLNVVRLLEQTACTNCLTISNATLYPANELAVDLTLKHPFAGYLNYTAFDVRGIFISPSDYTFLASGRKISWGADMARIMNADGYTTLFNPTEFPESGGNPPILRYFPGKYSMDDGDLSCTLNPYIAYAEDVERRMFAAGSSKTRTVRLRLPDGPLEFGYAVDGCWTPVDQVTNPLTDFPPDANCLEAYRVDVSVGSGLQPAVAGSSVPIEVEVFDHQGPDTINEVTIEAPDLFSGETALAFSTATGDESYLFTGVLNNDLGPVGGCYPILVKVTDTSSDPNFGNIESWFVHDLNISESKGWARTWGADASSAYLYGVTVGNSGNIFVTGSFENTVDFDPGAGVEERTSNGSSDAYISKYDATGEFLWMKTWGGTGNDWTLGISSDLNENIYMIGLFQGTVDFDPGPGVDERTGVGLIDYYVTKLNSDGEYQWALTWDNYIGITGVCVDTNDFVYITGGYSDELDFDPGPDVVEHDADYDGTGFLCKFNPAGEFQWVTTWGQYVSGWEHWGSWGDTVTTDDGSSVYVGAGFRGTTDMAPGPGSDVHTANGSISSFPDIALIKFDTSGNWYWAKSWGGKVTDEANDVAADCFGNVYVTGYFNDEVDFDPGLGTDIHDTDSSNPDAFLSKFNATGDFHWARTWGDHEGIDSGNGLDVDCDGSIYVTGTFWKTVDFDPGPGVYLMTVPSGAKPFLSKFHSTGEFVWARAWSGYYSFGYDIDLSGSGDTFSVGIYGGPGGDFDPGPGIDWHPGTGCYLIKIPSDGNW